MTRPTTVPPQSMPSLVPTASTSTRFGRASTSLPIEAGEPSGATNRAEAWQLLAAWLRQGRLDRGLSVADVARTTKIQARILEDLEAGNAEDLPADVFVRGFVRNFARCVGLSEHEALARYAACGRDFGPVASPAASAVAELYAPSPRKSRMSTVVPVAPGSPAAEVHARGPHAPHRAATSPGISAIGAEPRISRAITVQPEPVVVVAPIVTAVEPSLQAAAHVAEAVAAPVAEIEAPSVLSSVVASPVASDLAHSPHKRRRSRRRREERAARSRAQTVRPEADSDIYEDVAAPASFGPDVTTVAGTIGGTEQDASSEGRLARSVEGVVESTLQADSVAVEPVAAEPWVPKMPAPAPARRVSAVLPVLSPSLVIDDADPESASRLQEVRATERSKDGRDPTRRTFLPPILLESQERANRQGGLTLAVIILLIAATLTLSYLMRRPTSDGGGMTRIEAPAASLVG